MSIAIANTQTYENIGNGTSQTLSSYTPAAGSNRILVVRVHGMRTSESGAFTVDSVKFGGVDLTQAVTVSANSTSRTYRTAIWYLINPSSSSGDIVATFSHASNSTILAASTLTGAKQTSPVDDTDSATATDGVIALTLNVTSGHGDMGIAAVTSHCNNNPTYSWTNATEDYDIRTASNTSSEVSGSGANHDTYVNVTATESQAYPIVGAGAVFLPAVEAQSVAPSGKAILLGKGTAVIGRGAVALLPSGKALLLGKGTTVIGRGAVALAPSGKAILLGKGTAVIGRGAVALLPSGKAIVLGKGTTVIGRGAVAITASGLAVPLGKGTAVIGNGAVALSPAGKLLLLGKGMAVVGRGAVAVAPSGKAVATAFGAATVVQAGVSIRPDGLAVPLGKGMATVGRGAVSIAPAGKVVGFAAGTPSLGARIAPSGLVVGFAAGTTALAQQIAPAGMAVGAEFGNGLVAADGSKTIGPAGKAVPLGVGTTTVGRGAVGFTVAGQMVGFDTGAVRLWNHRLVVEVEAAAGENAVGTMFLTTTSLNVKLGDTWAAFRMTGLDVPGGAAVTVTRSVMELVPITYDDPQLTLRCERSISPAALAATAGDISGRTLTDAGGVWNAANLGTSGYKPSADFAPAVKEVLDLPGWSPGSGLLVTMRDNGTGGWLRCYSDDAGVEFRPRFVLEWEFGAVAQVVAPAGFGVALGGGVADILPGAVAVAPDGLAVGLGAGSASIIPGAAFVAPTGQAVALETGDVALPGGTVAIAPAGLALGIEWGEVVVAAGGQYVLPAGMVVGLGTGDVALPAGTVAIAPAGLALGIEWGEAAVGIGRQYVRPAGLAVAALLGGVVVAHGRAVFAPAGLALDFDAGGTMLRLVIAPAGLAAGAGFGGGTVGRGTATIAAAGLAAGIDAGGTMLRLWIRPAGLAAGVGFGGGTVGRGTATIAPAGLALDFDAGTALVAIGRQYVKPAGLSAEALFGLALVALLKHPRLLTLTARGNGLALWPRDGGLSLEERGNELTVRGRE